ncbi:MAG: hypothetical protein JRF33_21255, partial [Deltaproteobacteria bacterium]|nr:hypothetical protein [Deltaproteobacteria bacterium]
VFNAVCGTKMTMDDYLTIGARTWLIKRALINMMGITAKDDRLPAKVLIPLEEGGAAGSVPDQEKLRKEYYQARGLNDQGWPTKETLEAAGLKDVADRLHQGSAISDSPTG